MLTPGERTLIVSLRGTPARLAFLDTHPLALEGTLDVAGAGTFGDPAVVSPDGRFVYMRSMPPPPARAASQRSTFASGQWWNTFLYPGPGRPHGIAYVEGYRRK